MQIQYIGGQKKLLFCLYLISILFSDHSIAKEAVEEPETQVPLGNFSLPASQQPGPLFAFGQNILNKNDGQIFTYLASTVGPQKNYTEIIPSFLYAISDQFSLLVSFPVAAHYRLDSDKSSGLEDISVQAEYAFYGADTPTTAAEGTIVANIGFPSGSLSKNPPTGFGGITIFAGATLSYGTIYWYIFTSQGTLLTTSHKQSKLGNQFLYQFGVERCVNVIPGWITAFMLELHGIFMQRETYKGVVDANSGGNIFFAAPSVWFSSECFIAQAGFGIPIVQRVNGIQRKTNFVAAVNFGWKI
jgi:hypothetical protein